MASPLLLRADGGPRIGSGHLVRCLALAQRWREVGGRAVFAAQHTGAWIEELLCHEGIDLLAVSAVAGSQDDAAATAGLARDTDADWVVVDGYRFGPEFQRTVRDAGPQVLVLDDSAQFDRYHADILVNQNLHAREAMYVAVNSDTRLLLGTRYALLRREFSAWADALPGTGTLARKLLVTLGGGTANHVALQLLRTLEPLGLISDQHGHADSGLEVTLVTGESSEPVRPLQREVGSSSVRHLSGVSDMPSLMAESDVALSAAGTTCWELALMGVPMVVFSLADNQRPVARSLAEAGVAVDLGDLDQLDEQRTRDAVRRLTHDYQRRQKMGERGRQLVDGEGSHRVVMHMLGEPFRLRRSRPRDCRLLWTWANEQAVRDQSFSSEPIPWEDHRRWFARKLADPNTEILIAVDHDDIAIGQVRFDFESDEEAEIAVSVASDRRGCGLGSRLIELGSNRLFLTTKLSAVHAFIKPQNEASLRAFASAGFVRVSEETRQGLPAVHCVKSRPT